MEVIYTVQPGDTLSLIAQKFNLCPRFSAGYIDQEVRAKCWAAAVTLANLNAIANPDLIQPGWELRIPVPEAPKRKTSAFGKLVLAALGLYLLF